jgi:hypothetical protein
MGRQTGANLQPQTKLWNSRNVKIESVEKRICLSSQKNLLKMCQYVFSLSHSVTFDGSVFGRVKAMIILHMLQVLHILIGLNADPRGSGFGSATMLATPLPPRPARDTEVKTDHMVINNNIIGL